MWGMTGTGVENWVQQHLKELAIPKLVREHTADVQRPHTYPAYRKLPVGAEKTPMVTTRHAAVASPLPATAAAGRRSTRKAAQHGNAEQAHTVEPAATKSTRPSAAARRQRVPIQPVEQDDGQQQQHKTLQDLASMLWQALDDENHTSSSDEPDDDDNVQHVNHRKTTSDDSTLAWNPTLALDALPVSTTLPMRKEPGLAAQPRALPRTGQAPQRTTPRWTELPAQEINDQVKRDLRLLRLRAAYDPTRHYKAWGKGKFPKNFAFGTVVQGPGEFFTGTVCWNWQVCFAATIIHAQSA